MQSKQRGRTVGEIVLLVTALGTVAALLFKEGAGALVLFDHEKDFTLDWRDWLAVLGAAFIGLAAFGIAFWNANALKTRHAEHLVALEEKRATPQQKTIKRYRDQNYDFVANLDFQILSDEGATIENLQATLLALRETQDGDGYASVKAVIAYPDGHATDLEVGMLFDSMSWQKGSVTKLGPDDSGGMDVADAFKAMRMSSIAHNADQVVCFGLASNDEGDDAVKNDALSDVRAFNLCRAIRNLDLIKRTDTDAVAVGFGQPQKISGATTESLLQRSAVVVAVSNLWNDLDDRHIALAVTALTAPQGIKLDKYARSNGAFSLIENVQKGPYRKLEDWKIGGTRDSRVVARAKKKAE